MPPCFDVYVWVDVGDRAATLSAFIDRYVNGASPGDPRFQAFLRTYVTKEPLPGDAEALADLRRGGCAGTAFSLYLTAKGFHEAIVTLTEEGDVVLGLGIDDPLNDPSIEGEASNVLAGLMDEFAASAGIGGGELPPPHSAAEWAEGGLVVLRVGSV
jgi:hypothetical protein